jgi:glycyl-tRNA synthetase
MHTLYERNGLIFWSERDIKLRNMMVSYFVDEIKNTLKTQNKAFEIIQTEAPLLTPVEFINKNYSTDDYYVASYKDLGEVDLVLRPETTMGSYQYAQWLLSHTENRMKMPLCIWQHGKSFRQEQDQVTKNMRLKEFYQLEFQCIYGLTTQNDYSLAIISTVERMLSDFVGPCHTEDSDRLPDYSEKTVDVICDKTNMEICSISLRKDFTNAKVLEVAIGTDRCVFNFNQ